MDSRRLVEMNWPQPKPAGQSATQQRAVGLNELLHAYGIDDAAADALLTQNDDHRGLQGQAARSNKRSGLNCKAGAWSSSTNQ